MTYNNYEERDKKFNPQSLPTSIKRKIYVCFDKEATISIWDCDMSSSDRILLCEMFVDIKIPTNQDLRQKMIEALQNEINEVKAKAFKKERELQERINSLLALEYHPEEMAHVS